MSNSNYLSERFNNFKPNIKPNIKPNNNNDDNNNNKNNNNLTKKDKSIINNKFMDYLSEDIQNYFDFKFIYFIDYIFTYYNIDELKNIDEIKQFLNIFNIFDLEFHDNDYILFILKEYLLNKKKQYETNIINKKDTRHEIFINKINRLINRLDYIYNNNQL